MQHKIRKMVLTSFKNHDDLSIELGDLTNITGKNGAGKSSISEGVTWALYGVDTTGSTKFEPKPLDAEETTKTAVEIVLESDSVETVVKKEQLNGKPAKYFVNDVPQKAKEFDEIIKGLFFDKDLFLSIFNPVYFFSQHWQEQRRQLLQYVSEPLNKEVFAAKESLAKYLEERLKKNNIEEIEKIYKPRYQEKDKQYERAAERVNTLKEQLEKLEYDKNADYEALEKELATLDAKARNAKEFNDKAQRHADVLNHKERELQRAKDELLRLQRSAIEIRDKDIKEECHTCGQALQGESLKTAQENKKEMFNDIVVRGRAKSEEVKQLEAEIREYEAQPKPETVDIGHVKERYFEVKQILSDIDRYRGLAFDLTEAIEDKKQVLKDRNEAQAIIEAVKDFYTTKAELMVKKVGDLFTTISVKLFDIKKNGSINPTFEIEYEGKPYSKLSTAERIKCGLELAEVLIQQSGLSVPVFIDNAESILKFTAPSAQIITATVKNNPLKVEAK